MMFSKPKPVAASYTLRAQGTNPSGHEGGAPHFRDTTKVWWGAEYGSYAEAQEIGEQLCATPAFDTFTITATFK